MSDALFQLVGFILAIIYLGAWAGYAISSDELTFWKRILFMIYIASFVLCGWVLKESWVVIASKFNI